MLIDHGSASASEIVVGRDAGSRPRTGGRAPTRSARAWCRTSSGLRDGSKLLLTIAHYYTPSGRLIQRDYSKFDDREGLREDAYKDDVPSDSVLATRPKFKTAGGRTVYGGGGIYPDVVLKDPPNLTRPEIDMIHKRVFFDVRDALDLEASTGPQVDGERARDKNSSSTTRSGPSCTA